MFFLEPLVYVTRNNNIESIHYGSICIVDNKEKIIYNIGDPFQKIYFRSSAKPLQVIPLILSGAADKYNFSLREIAIACASHSGQPKHQEVVNNLLTRLELNVSNLHCGTMYPFNKEEREKLIKNNKMPSAYHSSCSGKHAAMLAYAKYKGYAINNYEKIENPVQQDILDIISIFSGENKNNIFTGIDGCGVPSFLLPIYKIALSYAKLMSCLNDNTSPYHRACKKIYEALTTHPDMVNGDGEFCTELMQHTHGKLIGKIGAEGIYCVGLKKENIGICIKISDGRERAVYPSVMQILKELDVLDKDEFEKLKHWLTPKLYNKLNQDIGNAVPAFNLEESKLFAFIKN